MAEIVEGTKIRLTRGYNLDGWPKDGATGVITTGTMFHEPTPKGVVYDQHGEYWAVFEGYTAGSLYCLGDETNFEVLEDTPCETEGL